MKRIQRTEIRQIEVDKDTGEILSEKSWDRNPEKYKPTINDDDVILSEYSKFSKVFHVVSDPPISDAHYKIWWRLVKHLEQDTNVVYRRVNANRLVYRARNVEDLTKICRTSQRTMERFLKDAFVNHCIACWRDDSGICYVLNPQYGANGKTIPRAIWDLFPQTN